MLLEVKRGNNNVGLVQPIANLKSTANPIGIAICAPEPSEVRYSGLPGQSGVIAHHEGPVDPGYIYSTSPPFSAKNNKMT